LEAKARTHRSAKEEHAAFCTYQTSSKLLDKLLPDLNDTQSQLHWLGLGADLHNDAIEAAFEMAVIHHQNTTQSNQ